MNAVMGTIEELKVGIELVELGVNAGADEYEVLEQTAEMLGKAKFDVEALIIKHVER